MTQEAPQKVSDMIRVTIDSTNDFFTKIAEHIDKLENTIIALQEKLSQYEDLTEQEVDDHK